MSWILESVEKRNTGLAVHYPTIYSIISGLEVKHAFEFGAGWSTKVILEAIGFGKLYSVSTDPQPFVASVRNIPLNLNWSHYHGKSVDGVPYFINLFKKEDIKLDFVLHDGAHDFKTVLYDLQNIVPYMKQFSILLVHDTLHSKCGNDTRSAVTQALYGTNYDRVTLPFGFGLDIIRINQNRDNGSIEITKNKIGSKYKTDIV